MPSGASGLTSFQRRVLGLIRQQVPAADGFALAGGGALLVHGLVDRATEDLDLFTTEPRDVPLAAAELRTAADIDGLLVEVVRSGASFVRLLVTDPDGNQRTLVDLAWDSRMVQPVDSDVGPVLSVDELAADKTLALFGRAEARDLVDVRALADSQGRERLLELAAAKDPGFDTYVFAQMLATTTRIPDADFGLPDDELAQLRDWTREWRVDLANQLLEDS